MRIIFLLLLLAPAVGSARETATPNDISDVRAGAYALTGATVQTDPDTSNEGATVLVRDGRIVEVLAREQAIPTGYVKLDLSGRHIYPALIDLHSGYGLPEPTKPARFNYRDREKLESDTKGAFNVNQAIRSQYRAADHFTLNPTQAAQYRKLGFGAVLTHMADGIARGTGSLVGTGEGSDNDLMLLAEASAHFSFSKGSSTQSYPISIMGAVALLRQTHLDAKWYEQQNPRPFTDQSLDLLLASRGLPQMFDAGSWMSLLRADQLGDEIGQQFIIFSGGDDYQRIQAVKATGAMLVVPVNFPTAPDVSDPWEARRVSLAKMKHWELAPTNPAAVAEAGVTFAITSDGADKEFWKNLRRAIRHGLSERDALAALTVNPAAMVGMQGEMGTITAGSIANILVASDSLFASDRVVQEVWIQGQRYRLAKQTGDYRGRYQLTVGTTQYELEVTGDGPTPKARLVTGDEEKSPTVTLSIDAPKVSLRFRPSTEDPVIRLTGWIEKDYWRGSGQDGDGRWVSWSLSANSGDDPSPAMGTDSASDSDEPGHEMSGESADAIGEVTFPFTAYGWTEKPIPRTLLLRNATVWTLEGPGLMENTDVLVRNGKIDAVGTDLSEPSAHQIDATGMHLTPGIIDEHSHIALSGVNDIATNSAMVRMADAVNSEDIGIYRNLAGGVTAAQLLHGSANPIGGQSALVKMRWGSLPKEMLIADADPFIKFALGENVKRSASQESIRYPQSRMGVEQVFRGAFTSALDYQKRWNTYRALSRRQQAVTPPPRKVLAMDAMAEILNSERFISCHSYVQSEINMLMKVAEDYDFRVNTFTHILEGYKVADIMAKHGVGGSSFSDWWAYKWEVRYAIPYNPALMAQAGVTVAINSDSAEMSRRLNQEAAKTVKYGGMDEIEALKMITLNPAKLLRLDDQMGSIRDGKDADLVLWDDHPLSIYAKPQMTIVDGIVYYDVQSDIRARDQIREERARLINRLLAAKARGDKTHPASEKPDRQWGCDSLHGYESIISQGTGMGRLAQ